MEVLPPANTSGPRRKPFAPMPQLRPTLPAPPAKKASFSLSPNNITSQGQGRPFLAFGNPPLAPRSRIASPEYMA